MVGWVRLISSCWRASQDNSPWTDCVVRCCALIVGCGAGFNLFSAASNVALTSPVYRWSLQNGRGLEFVCQLCHGDNLVGGQVGGFDGAPLYEQPTSGPILCPTPKDKQPLTGCDEGIGTEMEQQEEPTFQISAVPTAPGSRVRKPK